MMAPTYGDYVRYMKEAHQYAHDFNLTGAHNGDTDAFRHAYASAEMTREYGENWALALGNLNEVKGDLMHGQPMLERNMDLWNNAKGREIGIISNNPADTAARVFNMLNSGELVRGLGDPRLLSENFPPSFWVPATMTDPMTGFGLPWPGVDLATNTNYLTARNYLPRKDPLVLDLDGGGIATTPINPNAPLLFDTDGDGVRTATGWVGAGEALVVRDLNGNGLIDSGRELFGDATLLTQGPNAGHTAANGFAALADLDSNADGQFDAADAAFASVRLWLDANQDGISQPAERKHVVNPS